MVKTRNTKYEGERQVVYVVTGLFFEPSCTAFQHANGKSYAPLSHSQSLGKTVQEFDIGWTLHKVWRGVKSIYGCVHRAYCIENRAIKAWLLAFAE